MKQLIAVRSSYHRVRGTKKKLAVLKYKRSEMRPCEVIAQIFEEGSCPAPAGVPVLRGAASQGWNME